VAIWTDQELTNEKWRRGNLSSQLKPTQKEIYDWWNSTDAILSLVHARRGFGKTWFFLTLAFEAMARNGGRRMVYAAPSREMAKSIVIPTAELLIPKDLPDEIKPVWAASEHAFIHPRNGSRCVIEGADDDHGKHLRGPFAHEIYMDELAFWRHCNYVYRSVLYPQVQRTGGRMLGASTSPESPSHEFATVLIPEATAEGSYIKVTIDDDYTLDQAAKDTIAAQFDAGRDAVKGRESTMYRREYKCDLVTETERAVIPEFNAMFHVKQWTRPEYYDAYTVLDLGMTDLTHCLLSYYDFDNATIVIENEVVRQYCTVSQLAPQILDAEHESWGKDKQIKKRVSDAQPISLAEFARQHVLQPDLVPKEMRFSAANNRDPEALINRARSLFASNRIVINPRCTELIKQCVGGLWNIKRTDFDRIPGLGHLDGLMALVYTVDTIDYSTNPTLMQKKYKVDDYPVEMLKPVQTNQHRSLEKLLPKAARRPVRRSHASK
jgi:hypothetical protein